MKNLSFHTKLMTMLLIHLVLFGYAVTLHWNIWYFIVAWILGKFIGYIGNEIPMHRLWSHRSFKTAPWKEVILHIFSVPLLCGSSIAYAAIHRQHHRYSDTEKDSHPYESYWKTFFFLREGNLDISPRLIADLIKDPTHRWLHEHYFKINSAILLVCLLVIGPVYTGWFVSSVIVYSFVVMGLVNIFGHKPEYGTRNFDTADRSTNNKWLQFLTWNHGLHNNHHRYPSSHRMTTQPGEFDAPAWIIEKFFLEKKQDK